MYLSPYIIAIVSAWLVAHGVKYSIGVAKRQRMPLRKQLFISGGMPSSHSAVVVAVTTVIGLRDGVDSAIFGLACALVLIVIYDAVHVRLMAGRTAEAVNQLIAERTSTTEQLIVARGHTVLEVTVGIVLGALIGLVVFLATQ